MAAGPQLPEGAASNVDYWLRRCEGFRVDSPGGRVGFVEEVRYASRLDRPDLIVVRAGLLGRLLLIVPVGEIAEICPREDRIVLLRSPRPAATERLEDRREPAPSRRPGRSRPPRPEGAGREPSGSKPKKEVVVVLTGLLRRIGLRRGRGGEREMTPDVEPSAEPAAEEPSAEEPAGEEAAAEEAAEAGTSEAVPAEEPAAEEPSAEEPPAEEQQPTA